MRSSHTSDVCSWCNHWWCQATQATFVVDVIIGLTSSMITSTTNVTCVAWYHQWLHQLQTLLVWLDLINDYINYKRYLFGLISSMITSTTNVTCVAWYRHTSNVCSWCNHWWYQATQVTFVVDVIIDEIKPNK
jgi:hypothetical protein